jgi:hypothetical protein
MIQRIALMAIVWFCVLATPEQSWAADCPIGSKQTLTGTLSMVTEGGYGGWVSTLPKDVRPCSVGALRGQGGIPAGCDFGKRFTATGNVEDALERELAVTSIRCQ